nr:DUF4932 domain-containing protein [uncultured Allomuricauda sp.]
MRYLTFFFVTLIITLNYNVAFAQNSAATKKLNPTEFKIFKKKIKGATISIDPRIELFQIFELVAGNPNVNGIETDYKLKIINYFQKHRNHPSLEFYRKNHQKYFKSIDAPYPLLISLNKDFAFRNDLIHNNWENHEDIDKLLDAIKVFALDTEFIQFFNSQSNFYELLIANTVYSLNDFDEKDRMLDYYGIDQKQEHTFNIVLNILGMGNFGPGIESNSGTEHYAIVSAGDSNGELPSFSKGPLEYLIWHEFGHSFTNPLVDKYWNEFHKLSVLNVPIKESMSAQAYKNWKAVVCEHMTRAVSCRMSASKYSEVYTDINTKRHEVGRKFIYTIPILDALKEYEQSRTVYPTLDSFMPILISRLKEIKQDSIDLWLTQVKEIRKPDLDDIPESSDFFERDNQLIIFSTGESDINANNKLKKYVFTRFPNIEIMADTLALKTNLSNYNLLVLGTPTGNKFIEKYISELPIKMNSEQLITNKIYEGTGYAFLTGWVHPQSTSKTMTLYIAQNPIDLVNFTMVDRGGTDYHIMKNLITLKAKDYIRINKIWSCK